MRISTAVIVGLSVVGLTWAPVQAAADAKVYPYASHANYCPAGLQPVSISGVVCCGKPNQHATYQQVMATPAKKKKKPAGDECPIGVKGC